jgi:hypothetical protein
MTNHEAACSCGHLRLTCQGDPVRVSMCHCLECQRRQLKAHPKVKTPVVEVAKAMKRTEAAVRQKAKTIGIGLGHRR